MINDTSNAEGLNVQDQHDQSAASSNYIRVQQVCDILGRSEGSIRQLISRGKIKSRRRGFRNLEVSLESVLSFFSRHYCIPAWEDNQEAIRGQKFILLVTAAAKLYIAPSYVLKLIRQGKLEGYATSHGDILVSVDSIDNRLSGAVKDANDL